MHPEAFEFTRRWAATVKPSSAVIEIGSRDVNGTIRGLFPDSRSYVGLDIADGPLVDWIGDAADYQAPELVDAVVTCEVLEHAPDWRGLLQAAASWLKPGGLLIVTAAGPGRKPHGADGSRRPKPDEHYENVTPEDLSAVLRDLCSHTCVEQVALDVRSVAWR